MFSHRQNSDKHLIRETVLPWRKLEFVGESPREEITFQIRT